MLVKDIKAKKGRQEGRIEGRKKGEVYPSVGKEG